MIRYAIAADVEEIAGIHVRAWQWAYRGQLDDAYLDGLSGSLPQRLRYWGRRIANGQPDERTWVADIDGHLVGFASTARSRDAGADVETAEVEAIYLEPEHVGTGVGNALFTHAIEDLRERGYARATLWVLETNARAIQFYQRAGWLPDGARKTDESPARTLHEVRYYVDLIHPR